MNKNILKNNFIKYEIFINIIQKSLKIFILTHQNADPDALCASYALQHLIQKFNKNINIKIITPGGVNELSQPILTKFSIKTVEKFESDADLIILVDTGSTWTLGPLKIPVESASTPLIVVDHHPPIKETLKASSLDFIDEQSTSTCEIVYQLYQRIGIKPSKRVSQSLLTGLMFDSRHFVIATSKTFETACHLCRLGASPKSSSQLLHTEMGISEKIARLKSAQRCRVFRIKKWIIASSHLNSYQASGARALIQLGADVAIVGGGKKNIIRVNLRSTDVFEKVTSLHLGKDIAESVGHSFKGSGGGHSTAAGAITYTKNYEEVIDYTLTLFSHKLGVPVKEVK